MKKKLLLVEDDLFLRDIYLETLRSDESLEVDFAEDGRKAYEKIKQGGWDLVMLDVVMPVYSGVEVLKKFDNDELKTLAKHIVFMTNTDDKNDIEEVIKKVDDIWLKSAFNPQELLAKVKSEMAEK